MRINKSVEAMKRQKEFYAPNFKISSEKILKLGNRQFHFCFNFWFKIKNTSQLGEIK